ncbi:MAG: hypothetical protein PHW04_12940 [Candidatus Wallbacteria bacterium]|nr:hypothetical protein [Candidatus Wallbacteria bacterium]
MRLAINSLTYTSYDSHLNYSQLKKSLDLCLADPETFKLVGYLLTNLNYEQQVAITVQLFEKALKRDPENPVLICILGWNLYRSQQYEKAIPVLEKLDTLGDSRSLKRSRQYEKAISILEKLDSTGDRITIYMNALLKSYVAIDIRGKARKLHEKMLKINREQFEYTWKEIKAEELFAGRDADRKLNKSLKSIEPKLKHFNNKAQFNEIRLRFEDAIAKSYDKFQMCVSIGILLQKHGLFQESILYLDRALGISDPISCNNGYYQAETLLAKAYNATNKISRARDILEEVTFFVPDLKEAQFELGIAYNLLGMADEVQNQYGKLLELDPKLAKAIKKRISGCRKACNNNGSNLTMEQNEEIRENQQNKKEQQIDFDFFLPFVSSSPYEFQMNYFRLKKAFDLCLTDPETFKLFGYLLTDLTPPENSAIFTQLYEKALKLEPENPVLICRLGISLTQSGQYEKVIELLEKLEPTGDCARSYRNTLLELYVVMDNRGKARNLYKKMLKINRKETECFWQWIKAEELFAGRDADRKLIKSLKSIEPKLKHFKNKAQFNEISLILEDVIVKSYEKFQMFVSIGRLLQEHGLFQESIQYIARAWDSRGRIEYNYCCYQVRILCAKACYMTDKISQAREILEELTFSVPDLKEAQFELGITYHLLGLTEEVQNQKEKLSELKPKLAKAYIKRVANLKTKTIEPT